ncbi:MAG: BatA and WFA domain-containing protein [Gemmatimonadota bacterium]|jgi:hypothetical protein|nr:BatA and WFA domain-containing protein [Gemmatimonadota bacterium]MDP6803428.1 BatA and WFA domain-containing protein [Gemmatimonadota bacterium]MDP7030935.1 BatA and WFA domain-containing protein [Gemmatimonadota bacterium]
MTFLNPWFLLGLAATAVPVVIHLLSRRTARRQDFSTLDFLLELEKRSLRRLRIRRLLLLLLRVLAVAAVALAMARPTLTSHVVGASASTSAVIVLDATFSMRAPSSRGTRMDAAREIVGEVLDSLSPGDEITLLAPGAAGGERGTLVAVRGPDALRDRLTRVRAGAGGGSVESALREAVAVLSAARNPNREVHIVSDFPTGTDFSGMLEALPEGVRVHAYSVALEEDPSSNAWVESVGPSGQILSAGTPVEFRAVVAAAAGRPSGEAEVEFEVDGQLVDRRRVDLGPSSRVGVVFRTTFRAGGLHTGSVFLHDEDGMAGDDRRHFTVRVEEGIPVLLVAEDPDAGQYLGRALAPGADTPGGFAVITGGPRAIEGLSTSPAAVAVLADPGRFTAARLEGIKAFLSRGGGLLLFPGPLTDAPDWDRTFLKRFLPGRLTGLRRASSGGSFRIVSTDGSHPLFRLFGEDSGALGEVRFTRALGFRAEPGTRVLAEYGNGDAAILESALLPGRVLLFTSSLHPEWSDFPLTGAFLPLLHEAVRYLAESASPATREVSVGEGALVHLVAAPAGGAVTVTGPGGKTRTVVPEPEAGGYALSLDRAGAPGIWTFTGADGDTLAAVAATVPAAESDPAALRAAELHSRLQGRGELHANGSGIVRQLTEIRTGREIAGIFLWFAAVFLALEMLLAGRLRIPEHRTTRVAS